MKAAPLFLAGLTALSIVACGPRPEEASRKDKAFFDALSQGKSLKEAKHESRDEDSDVKLKTITALSCPETEGSLSRTKISSDGMVCDYTGEDGTTVQLRLIKTKSEADLNAALSALDTELKTLQPAAANLMPMSKDSGTDSSGKIQGHLGSGGKKDGLKLDFNIDEGKNGKGENVHIGGAINGEQFSLITKDNLVHIFGRSEQGGITQKRILVDETSKKTSTKSVGYELRGPKSGPFVAVVVKTNETQDDKEDNAINNDADSLLYRNVGGKR